MIELKLPDRLHTALEKRHARPKWVGFAPSGRLSHPLLHHRER